RLRGRAALRGLLARLGTTRLRRGGALLGLLDQAAGLGDRAVVVVGRLASQTLLLHRQGAAGLLHLAVDGSARLLDLALRLAALLGDLLLRGETELVGLALRRRDGVLGLRTSQAPLLLRVGQQPS